MFYPITFNPDQSHVPEGFVLRSTRSEGKVSPGLPALTCVAEMPLVWMAVVVPWVPVHLLLGVGRGHVDLLGMRVVRHVRLGHHGIAAGA